MPWPRLAVCLTAGLLLAAPVAAQNPPPPAPPITGAPVPVPLNPGDAFGEEVTLPERTIVYVEGEAHWDVAFATLLAAYKSLAAALDKQGIKPAGPALTIYTQTDDAGFKFRAAFPVAAPPNEALPAGFTVGPAPSGRALKFVHRGSYEAMDTTYEAITNYLDDKQLDAKDVFVEEYQTDILTTPPDALVVQVFVPVK